MKPKYVLVLCSFIFFIAAGTIWSSAHAQVTLKERVTELEIKVAIQGQTIRALMMTQKLLADEVCYGHKLKSLRFGVDDE